MQVAGANEDILSGGTEAPVRQAGASAGGAGNRRKCLPNRPRRQSQRRRRAIAAASPRSRRHGGCDRSPPSRSPKSPPAAPDKHPIAAPSRPEAAGTLVQLAAVHSEEAARTSGSGCRKRMPDLLAQHQPRSARSSTTARRCGGCAPAASATLPRRRPSASGFAPRVQAARSPPSEEPPIAGASSDAGPTLQPMRRRCSPPIRPAA